LVKVSHALSGTEHLFVQHGLFGSLEARQLPSGFTQPRWTAAQLDHFASAAIREGMLVRHAAKELARFDGYAFVSYGKSKD